MYNQDYDGQNPIDQTDPAQAPVTSSTPNGVNMSLLGYDGQTEVYQGSDGQRYVVGPNGANGLSTWAPYTGTATTFSSSPVAPAVHEDPVNPPTSTPPPTTSTTTSTSPYPSGQPAPTFTPPAYTPPPAFNYADFVAPNPNDLNNDPAYQYTLKTEQDRIQKSAAARGVLNTGGTINDLLGNAADIAGAGYHDLFNRSYQTYMTNRGNALDAYNTNYGTQYTDPYKFSYQGLQDQYNAGQHNFDAANQYAWYGKLFDEQKANDLFNHKFSIYSTL